MRKSKSWAPSRSGAACADTAEGCDDCCCDVDTPGAGDSWAVDDNKLSCSVASKQIEHGFIGLTRHKISDCDRKRAWPQTERINCTKARHRSGARFAASPG